MVPGEQISAKIRWSSSHAVVVPLGDRLGVPSGQTVAIKPSFCRLTNAFISFVRIPIFLIKIFQDNSLQFSQIYIGSSVARCKIILTVTPYHNQFFLYSTTSSLF